MCRVSVLVPIYNVEKYLECCLSSLAAQDMEEIEIICLNDGSQDNSAEIAHRFEQAYDRFRVIDKPNSGYGKTMNLGLTLAKGEYIGIVESDDFVEEDMFSCLYEIADKNQADVVKSAFWIYSNGLDVFEDSISDIWYDRVISNETTFEVFGRNPSIWSNLYRRAFLMENNICFSETPGASFQDIAWRTKIFASAKRAVFTKKAFYHYRRDNINASVRGDGKLYCVCDEYDEAERFLSSREDWEDKYKYLLPSFKWGHYVWNCFGRGLSLGHRWEFYKYMRQEMLKYEKAASLRRDFWNKNEWLELQNMLLDGRQFFFDNCVLFWRRALALDGLVSMLNSAPKLAVYGAGKIGHEALKDLCLHVKRPDCFVVSDISGNATSINGVPVKVIDELLPEKADYVILIATGKGTQPEILAVLLEKGFENVIPFIPEIHEYLC